MNNFIYWEQAVRLEKHLEIAEEYEKQILEIVMFFGKNTLAQMMHMELYMDSLEAYGYYRQRDYSKFLFDKTEAIFDSFNDIKPAIEELTPKFQELAKNLTEKILKTI